MKQIFIAFLMFGLGISTAAASTLRVTCEDQAAGAEVTINDKYKGECPIDIQLNEGKHSLKAVKKINGKNAVFQEQVKIGDGVTKRIEVIFGGASGKASPATGIRVDQNAIAKQRYAVEMEEYNRSVRSCLPKYSVEHQRLKDVVSGIYDKAYNHCIAYYTRKEFDDPESKCGNPTWDGKRIYVRGEGYDESREYKDYLNIDMSSAEKWCADQFTRPEAP
jgi:hypothetical protein